MSAKNTLRTLLERVREIVCLLTGIRSITIYYRPIGHINAFPTLTATVIAITCNNDDSAYDNIVVCDPSWTVLRYSVGVEYGPPSTRGHFPARYTKLARDSIFIPFFIIIIFLTLFFFSFRSTCTYRPSGGGERKRNVE